MRNPKLLSVSEEVLAASEHYHQERFRNSTPHHARSFLVVMYGFYKRKYKEKPIDQVPSKNLPLQTVTRTQLDNIDNDDLYIIKLGHSSILLKVYGEYWLIDPVFSERASPFTNFGPKRFQPTPIAIDELPHIDKVIISHNHYDHLDKNSIINLHTKTQQFLVPLGVETDLQQWGVDKEKIKSFNWWQEYQTDNALFAFTPARHFSGRTLKDRNHTLWGSWVIKTSNESLFFSGDSGYFEGFKEIGNKYGPFDLTMIETGAYSVDWPAVHMLPEDSVKAHLDLKGKTMMPIHNSTFDLSMHAWYEPLERVSVAAEKSHVTLTTPFVGEVITARQEGRNNPWWVDYK